MDAENWLFVNKRVVTTIRSCGLLVSTVLAGLTVAVYYDWIHLQGALQALCWPLAIGFVLLGVTQAVWNPYTRRKALWYVYLYCMLGMLLNVFIVGFSSMAWLGWLMLIVGMNVYFGRRVASVGIAAVLLSIVGWLARNQHDVNATLVTDLLGGAVMVVAAAIMVMAIWEFARDSVRNLQESSTREQFEHEQLTSLINSMADGVIAIDASMDVVLYNAAALDVLDINGSLEGRALREFMKPINAEGQPVDITKIVRAAKLPTINRDLRMRYGDGSTINLYLAVAPVHLQYRRNARSTDGFVLMVRDITREKSLEEERNEFISVVSHELRTPIAITEGNISNARFVTEKTGDMTQVKSALDAAHEQVVFLAGLVNDLSTLSRAERGVLEVEVEPIDPNKFVQELAQEYADEAHAKGLKIKTELAPHLKPFHSSKLYSHEVLQNFVTNAIKYTEKGTVTIGAMPDPRGIRFHVSDTGIGISKPDQEKIFDKFFRSEDYRTRQNNGTGLGLYVTIKLARILHAEVSVKSELNKGSTFTIFIPNLAERPKTSRH